MRTVIIIEFADGQEKTIPDHKPANLSFQQYCANKRYELKERYNNIFSIAIMSEEHYRTHGQLR